MCSILTKDGFKRLFDSHFDPLRNYIYYKCGDSDLATDIAQETFMKLWEKQLDKSPEDVVALLYKMAKDTFISRYRKQKLEQTFKMKLPEPQLSLSPADELYYSELESLYEKALNSMPDTQREVFLMSRMDDLKYSEIADRLGLSIKAIEKRMSSALNYLRLALTVQ